MEVTWQMIHTVCPLIFMASAIDAIAGGGGIISVPVYLLAFSGIPTYYVLGTNKFTSCMGTIFSTRRMPYRLARA